MAEEQKNTVGEVSELPPPPVYQQEGSTINVGSGAAASPPKYAAKPVPLPTYAQSEQYEKEGIMPPSTAVIDTSDSDSSEAPFRARRWDRQNGTCFEFVLYFIVCAVFSVFGFLISFCVATNTAAQSGAIAGLGTAFISKPFLYEMYYRSHDQQWTDWCAQYTHTTEFNNCIYWSNNTMRTLAFVLGFFGIVLLYRGFASFFASRHNN